MKRDENKRVSPTPHLIASVEPGGIADQCGIKAGDALISINGEPVLDQVDYQFLSAQSRLTLTLSDAKGEVEIVLEKDADEPLGLTFASTLMSKPRVCANRCVFCFIDQLPKGCRKSLYVKDDDWRLSLMMGNYITLTNLSERELSRIIARRASPLYLSIHATDGAVRARMMRNPAAGNILETLRRLAKEGIAFHCQIVLCPGVNDGAVLDETLQTLADLHPAARSVALVPVGLTAHRQGLTPLRPYDKHSARALLEQAHAWQERFRARLGTAFAFAADEFYCLANAPIPSDAAYEEYPQLENGVGLLRGFMQEFDAAYRMNEHVAKKRSRFRRVVVATGVSAAPHLRALLSEHPIAGLDCEIVAVQNRFFGGGVTVAGLLTGGDLVEGLRGMKADGILFPREALRHEGDVFLDGLSPAEVEKALGVPVRAVGCDGAEFLAALCGEREV